jgi:hypothetical protein
MASPPPVLPQAKRVFSAGPRMGPEPRRAKMSDVKLRDTAAWRFQVVAAFAVALVLTTGGVLYLSVDVWTKGYLLMGIYFTVSSCFGLAKSLRDAHESHQITAKIAEAKTEKILRELAHS